MSLSCQLSLSYASYTAGQTPPPTAYLLCYNPTAAPIVVTGVQLTVTDYLGNKIAPPIAQVIVPTGPGQTVAVPAGDDITIGPFSIAVGSAANANPFQMVNQTGNLNPVNPQPSQPPQSILLIGAEVYGSDRSINVAGVAALLVSYTSQPPLAYQGGFFNFSAPNNFITGLLMGAL